MTKRSHTGIAYREGERHEPIGHPVDPSSPNPRNAVCRTCDRPVHYVRRTYGPHARAAHWQHTGDGLVQFRSWNR